MIVVVNPALHVLSIIIKMIRVLLALRVNWFLLSIVPCIYSPLAFTQDINEWPCDIAYRFVGRPLFGAWGLPYFGFIHGGDSALDVACHLERIPGVVVQIETVENYSGSVFRTPDQYGLGKLTSIAFDGRVIPIIKFQNFVMNGVALDGEVRFRSATSSLDSKLLGLAHMRLSQERRLSSFLPAFGLVADVVDRIDLWSAKPVNEFEKRQFFDDRQRVAGHLISVMEDISVPVKHSLANQGAVWFEQSRGLTVSMESRVEWGIEISISYNFEKDDSALMKQHIFLVEELLSADAIDL